MWHGPYITICSNFARSFALPFALVLQMWSGINGTATLGQPGSPHTYVAHYSSRMWDQTHRAEAQIGEGRWVSLVGLGMILDPSMACLPGPIRHPVGMVLEQISEPAASAGSPVAPTSVSAGGSASCLCQLEVAVSRHLSEKRERPTHGGDIVRTKRLKFMFGFGKEFEKHKAFRRDNDLVRPCGELVMCTSLSSRPIPRMNTREEDLLHIIWLMFEKRGLAAVSQLVVLIRVCSLGPAAQGPGPSIRIIASWARHICLLDLAASAVPGGRSG
jgi:hypothetical protein